MWLPIALKPYPINYKPKTKDQQPKTKDQQPTTKDQQPKTNDQYQLNWWNEIGIFSNSGFYSLGAYGVSAFADASCQAVPVARPPFAHREFFDAL